MNTLTNVIAFALLLVIWGSATALALTLFITVSLFHLAVSMIEAMTGRGGRI